MIVAVGALAGVAAGALLLVAMRPVLDHQMFSRLNYRDVSVPTGAGLVLVLSVLVVEAVMAVLEAADVDLDGSGPARRLVVLAALGFGLLGLLDDLAGGQGDRGFRGHLRALGRGRLTTGSVKLLAGGAVAVAVAAGWTQGSLVRVVRDAALIALAANLGNLFDRAPGRTTKVALLSFAVLAVLTGAEPSLAGVAVAAGAALALLVPELREQVMLGDTGANALGAVLGVGVVVTCSGPVRTAVALSLAALNLVSEVVSFSQVIDRVPPLRALDRAGRRRAA